MEKWCNNCRFCIYTHSMRGKEEPYCERHSKLIGNTILCSEWEAVIVPKSFTNADRIRSMTDEELAFYIVNHPMWIDESACVNWLKQEA